MTTGESLWKLQRETPFIWNVNHRGRIAFRSRHQPPLSCNRPMDRRNTLANNSQRRERYGADLIWRRWKTVHCRICPQRDTSCRAACWPIRIKRDNRRIQRRSYFVCFFPTMNYQTNRGQNQRFPIVIIEELGTIGFSSLLIQIPY